MHRRKTLTLTALILCFALSGALSRTAAAHERKYIFMDEPIAPYTYGPDGGVCEKGLTKEIFDIVFGRLGLKYQIILMPWARVMDSVKTGKGDGIPLLIHNTERESFLIFSDPVVENREMLYYLPEELGDFQWERLEDLRGLHIGLVRGYTYGRPFLDAVEKYGIRISYGSSSKMILNMLQAGRVDAIVEDETLAWSILAEHPDWANRITTADKPLSSYHWHIGIYRASPLVRYVDAINRVLHEMHTDGSLKKIIDKRLGNYDPQ